LIIVLLIFTICLGAGAVYIGLYLEQTPTTAPVESKAATYDQETKIDYTFNGGNGTCTLQRMNDSLCLAYTGSYNQFAKHWCQGDWSSNSGGCSCPYNGYGSGAGQCATTHSPSPGFSSPGEAPACLDGQFGIQGCNPEIYFTHSVYHPNNYANVVCLDKTWCQFQQIDLLVSGSGYTCFLSGYMGDTDVCNATPTPTPTNTYTPTPTMTITYTPTPTMTITYTPTPTMTITYTPTPTITITYTPTPTMTITYTPTLTPSITVTVSPSKLPPTALVTDEIDQVIIGIFLIFLGVFVYQSGFYIIIGNLFWTNDGQHKARFEKQIIRDRENKGK